MKLFGLEIRRAGSPVSPYGGGGWSPLVREPFAGAWQRNREIRAESVLAHHAVYACITRIAQDIGKLRPRIVEQDEGGIWTETQSVPFGRVLRKPNRFQNHIQFKEWWVTSKLIHGNTYVLLRRDARQVVDAMYVLDPTRVTVLVAPDGEVFYQLRQDQLSELGLTEVAVPASEIIHDRANCLFHPLVGTSPIFACGTAANMGLRIEGNSADFFANGSNPSGILSSPVSIPPEKAKQLSQVWNDSFGGDRSGRVAVMGDAMKFEAMRMSAVDSQLIEQLQWTAETVCSTFHVPPFKVGVGAQPTYQNGGILNQVYYSDCLQSHIEAWELLMDGAFGFVSKTEGRQLGTELDLDGLLRMDSATQTDAITKGIRGGLFTPNEGRRKVDLPPLTGGDTIYLQHQDYPMEKVWARTDLEPAPEPAPAPAGEPVTEAVIADEAPEGERAARLARRASWRARNLRLKTLA